MPDAFGIYSAIRDKQGRIVDFRFDYVNSALSALNGFAREQMEGHTILEVLPAHRPEALPDRANAGRGGAGALGRQAIATAGRIVGRVSSPPTGPRPSYNPFCMPKLIKRPRAGRSGVDRRPNKV
jgi:hypothetical protein